MSYTTEGHPQGVARTTVNLIRESLMAELVAINKYNKHIKNSQFEQLNETWHHILEDEKRHYGMFLELVRKYDPVQLEMFEKAKQDVDLTTEGYEKQFEPEYSKQILINNIRSDIKGELEAILLYEKQLSRFRFKDIKQVFEEVIQDEKEHVEELTLAMQILDDDSYGPIDM
jgi:rubrerythrin